MTAEYRRCTRCVMDTSDPAISFDTDGVCNHCRRAAQLLSMVPRTDAQAAAGLARIVDTVRAASGDAEYQCLVGLSGGVDSSYVAWLARDHGLRVLGVHLDNGWDDEVAVGNIQRLCDALDIDLVTKVLDWDEFRDLQRSFLLASVVDVELPTDHAIFATMLDVAREHRIEHVLSGTNVATEAIMPSSWVWPKQDLRNIRAVHRRFGSVPLRTYPTCGILRWAATRLTGYGPSYVEVLNAVPFTRRRAVDILTDLGWRPYGDKHHESLFTKWYQAFLLPEKFGVDKRLAHLSNLVVNGELSREAALARLDEPRYDPAQLRTDQAFVLKKLGFTEAEWSTILAAPPRRHDEYPSSDRLLRAVGGMRARAKERSLRPAGEP